MTDSASSTAKPFAQWRLIAGIFAALFALLLVWYFFFLQPDYTTLYSELRPGDAAAIVAQLERQHVPYKLRDSGTRILVPAAQADSARLHVAAADISPNGVEGFELFDQSDMGLTEFAQKIKYQRALQGELARTIMMMDGVAAARVHISVPERSLFRGDQHGAKAAVTLITRSPSAETADRIEGIRRLVAASVSDLALADVVVLNERGEVLGPRPELLTAASPTPAQGAADPDSLLGARDISAHSLESVLTVVGPALPHRRVEVSIETMTPAPTDAAAPAAPLRTIVISTEEALSADDTERARMALRAANLIDGASGTVAAFRVGMPPLTVAAVATAPNSPPARASAGRSVAAHARAAPPRADALLWLALGAVLLGALAALALVTRARLTRPSLSLVDQQHFAERLSAHLQAQTHETHNEPA